MENSKLPTPYRSAAAVASEHTVDEWELGIPPDPIRRSGLNEWFSPMSRIVLSTWATTHPVTPVISVWFDVNS